MNLERIANLVRIPKFRMRSDFRNKCLNVRKYDVVTYVTNTCFYNIINNNNNNDDDFIPSVYGALEPRA